MEPVPRPPEQMPDGYDEDDINTFFDFAKIVHRFVFKRPFPQPPTLSHSLQTELSQPIQQQPGLLLDPPHFLHCLI